MLRRSRGLARTATRTAVIAGTATAVSGNVARRQHARQFQPAEAAPPPPAAPATGSALTSEVIDQLKQLADLKDHGVLTEEEFAAQKAKILGT